MKNPFGQMTLVELMIVVAIIGIVVSIAVPNCQRYMDGSSAGAADNSASKWD